MDCTFRGCDCWCCVRNDDNYICKYYREECYRKPSEKALCNCEHLMIVDTRNIIFQKTEQLVRRSKTWFNVVRIKLMLINGYFKDNVFGR